MFSSFNSYVNTKFVSFWTITISYWKILFNNFKNLKTKSDQKSGFRMRVKESDRERVKESDIERVKDRVVKYAH